MRRTVAILIAFALVWPAASTYASPTTDRIDVLEARVTTLEAQVAALLASPSPAPTPAATATPNPSAGASPWLLAWDDPFDVWDPSRYFVYGDPADGAGGWKDTQEQQIAGTGGFYSPTAYAATGGLLNVRLHTDSGGVPRVAAFIPQINSTTKSGDLLSMAVEFRIRADRMVGYKGVPLLWPASGVWPRDGEINWPESDFDKRPSAFMHRQGATSGSDQDWYPAPTGTIWGDWHTYRTELIAGTSCKFFIDGQLIGHSTERVPSTAMHLVMQFETDLGDTRPDPAVSGFVQIDWLEIWRYAP